MCLDPDWTPEKQAEHDAYVAKVRARIEDGRSRGVLPKWERQADAPAWPRDAIRQRWVCRLCGESCSTSAPTPPWEVLLDLGDCDWCERFAGLSTFDCDPEMKAALGRELAARAAGTIGAP